MNLDLWVDNTEPLYKTKQQVFKNLKRRKDKGTYDARKAPKAFSYVIERAAKDMHRTMRYGGDWHRQFPKKARDLAAQEMVAEFESEYRGGYLGAELREHEAMEGNLSWLWLVGLTVATVGIVVAATRRQPRLVAPPAA